MTPQEKAKELINKFKPMVEYNEHWPAKQCALIAADEVLNNIFSYHEATEIANEFWQQVKEEIERL